jgi:hypothetical protein
VTRIAAIYWPTSSVGGINTELMNLRAEADRRGDTFHVLRSGNQSGIKPGIFGDRKKIRGGDTFITIDGEAPHHPRRVYESAAFINANYDRMYVAYLCPHPTKAYGDRPVFIDLYKNVLLPTTSRVTDAYLSEYLEWGQMALDLVESATCSHRPILKQLQSMVNFETRHFQGPVFPRKVTAVRSKTPLTVWTSQWKAIKGIHRLLPVIPQIKGAVELYSNGILYYQLRTSPEWKAAVKTDHFKGFDGDGHADFFGNVDLLEIPNVLTRAWFMIDLMGIGRPKFKEYTEGTVNNTTHECFMYGCCPILHRQASKIIPEGLCLFVDTADEIPYMVNTPRFQKFAIDPERQKRAKEWILKHASPSVLYDAFIYGKLP